MLPQRGLEQEQEQIASTLLRDTRTLGKRIHDFLKKPLNVAILLFILGGFGFTVPALMDLVFLSGLILVLVAKSSHYKLPFRMPKYAKCEDYNSPKPGTSKPSLASGIYYLGNDRRSQDELWFTNEDMRTHVLIFGSTGSGKTESLISLAYNALVQSSGFIYVDGKGDNSVFAKIFSLVRSVGREDDLLLINFMTGARDIIGPQEKRLSNTMNPFSTGSSSMLSQLVVSLMESSSQQSSGDMWKGRAIAFVEALMRVLVASRDAGYILLDANSIRNYFGLERLEEMMNKVLVRDNQESVSLESFPSVVLEPIVNYLKNLPGYIPEKKGKQSSQVYEQHGYISMQLTRVFSTLADTYGHIIRTNLPEVDMRDVVLNRRILVVLLPALEKSPDELSNLGKIVVASLKTMMAAGLGDEVEGMYSQVISRKPTNANTPYLCILDEYGYYAVPGFAVVPAQARSLGFSVVFAGQDLPAFQRASKEEAASIGANTNIKICMKLEDPTETWEFFLKSAGESYVTQVGGFQTGEKSLTGQYLDTKSAQIEKRARIDLLDLKEQREGEAHVFFKSKIVRARMFYANPKYVKELRLNHFVKIDAPLDAVLRNLIIGFENIEKILKSSVDVFADFEQPKDEAKNVTDLFLKQDGNYLEKSIAALIAFHEQQFATETVAFKEAAPLPAGQIDIFSALMLSDYLKEILLEKNIEQFSQPILVKSVVQEHISQVEDHLEAEKRTSGRNIALEIIKDMQTATNYPPVMDKTIPSGDMTTAISSLIKSISLK